MAKPQQQTTPDYVAYYRVSTRKQGETGLGMQAQEACVESFAQFGGGRIIARFYRGRERAPGRTRTAPSWRKPRPVPAAPGPP